MPTEPLPDSVLFVVTRGDSIGGGQIHVRDFAFELKRRQVSVWVAVGSPGALTDQLEQAGVPWFQIPHLRRSINPLADLLAIRELMVLIRRLRPQLVSSHTAKAGMTARVAAFLTGTPVIFTAHGWQFSEGIGAFQKLLVWAVEWVLARMTRKIITVSEYDHQLARQFRLGPPSKIVVVHNGMPWIERTRRDRTGPVRLIMVARFQEQKDHATLLQALGSLVDLSWELDLIGDGPLLLQTKEMAKKRGLEKRIRFLGQRLDVPALLQEAEVFLLISHWEGFPRSIVEAMRAGLPAVVSDVGGCRESVQDGETGYLIPRQNVGVLTSRLRGLIEDPSLARAMGERGRERFEKEFTFQQMFERTAGVWSQVLSRTVTKV